MLQKTQTALFLVVFTLFVAFPAHAQSTPSGDEAGIESPAPAPETTGEPKRLFGVLPNYRTSDASLPFERLSARQKMNIARHDSFDWPSYVFAAGLALVTGRDPAYGTGVEGYANRYVRSAADQITGNILSEGVVPAITHQDPRYFRLGDSVPFWPRFRSAISQIAIAKNDSGKRTFNTGEWLGNAMAVGISNTYSPNLNSWSHRGDKLALMISTDTLSNVMKEFGPDLKQKFLHHHHKSS
jgi:hypothetical protein